MPGLFHLPLVDSPPAAVPKPDRKMAVGCSWYHRRQRLRKLRLRYTLGTLWVNFKSLGFDSDIAEFCKSRSHSFIAVLCNKGQLAPEYYLSYQECNLHMLYGKSAKICTSASLTAAMYNAVLTCEGIGYSIPRMPDAVEVFCMV